MDLDYQTIFKELNLLSIDYLVIGGLAVNFHGVPRMTYDIDLMILLEKENIIKLIDMFTKWGYKPKVPVNPQDLSDKTKRNSWINNKGMKAFNLYSDSQPIGEIDIVIDSPMTYDELKSRAVFIEFPGGPVPVVSIHDLITLKSYAGRKQDLADVEHLKLILEK